MKINLAKHEKTFCTAEAQKYKDAKSLKLEQFVDFFTTLFGECLARIFLLLLCGASVWRMIVTEIILIEVEIADVLKSLMVFVVSMFYWFCFFMASVSKKIATCFMLPIYKIKSNLRKTCNKT